MIKKRLLFIEDEKEMITFINLYSDANNYHVYFEANGDKGVEAVRRLQPDLVLLNILLPREKGFDICVKIKKDPLLNNIPILLLSTKSRDLDIILGLELGADDYIEKPFSLRNLFLYIKTLLHQKKENLSSVFTFGKCLLDTERYLLRKNGQIVPLSLSEFWALRLLLINRGKILTRNQILKDVNTNKTFSMSHNVDALLFSLREKLGVDADWIETIGSVGYRFKRECHGDLYIRQ